MTPPPLARSNTFLMLIYLKIRSTHVHCKQPFDLKTLVYCCLLHMIFSSKIFCECECWQIKHAPGNIFMKNLDIDCSHWLHCFGEGNFHTLDMPDVIWFRAKCSFIIHNIFKIKLQSLWEELYLLCPLGLPGRFCSIPGTSICQQYYDLGGIFPV